MAVALQPYEAVAIAGICKALRGSNLQARRPSYTAPSFWSRPIFSTAYKTVEANTDWQNMVVVQGRPQYVALIKQYVATTLGSLAASGLLFRMVLDGTPLTSISLTAGVEVNKEDPNNYPIIPREIFMPVNETQTFALQVKNPTGVQRVAIGMLAGWFFDAIDSTVIADSNAMVDGVSSAQVGVTYGR